MTAVHWLCCDLRTVPEHDDWLGPRERAVAAGLRIAKRRTDWRLGRWTAKQALVTVDATPPGATLDRIEVCAGASGAPAAFLDGQPLSDVAISLSHRDDVAVCALTFATMPVGCDLERVEPRQPVFVQDWFTAAERAHVDATPATARSAIVTLVWSAKESVAKALGEGWRLDPRDVSVGPVVIPTARWAPFGAVGCDRAFAGWGRALDGRILTIAAPAMPRPPRALVQRGGGRPHDSVAGRPARG